MKKFLITLTLLFLISPVFAKTVQCVKKFQVYYESRTEYGTLDVTPAIQAMINMGWKVVSITPVTVKVYYSNPTDYVIVVFEKEE
jgi:hypothetical protein